jgi:acetoacetyl-CoA synthetase
VWVAAYAFNEQGEAVVDEVSAIPYTLTGKTMEVPVRRILSGMPVEKAANRAAMSNVASLDYFVEYVREQRDYRLS